MTLAEYHVPGSVDTYYIPNFVTADEESYLLRKIQETPQPKWKQLSNRRLQTWGGDLTTKNVLLTQPLPPFICNYPDLISRIASTGAFDESPHQRPNHVILNEYRPGQGIMPHQDGPAYHPVVATLSLGSHTVMHYYDLPAHEREPILSLLLEPRSLVITTREQYTARAHGIDVVMEDRIRDFELANAAMLSSGDDGDVLQRRTRYSLTCRDVARVMNVGIETRFCRERKF
ncbi:hypothetical protein B0F90DRAFT_1644327 [Multifurca ochricompacta]|uniref:Fe2OG dioxygenase domain-containing protein n=1 Tax=Multifurca ochricompacta TaxID=376703 RepID=A0AAD4LX71_9AGAM|nr:hypothetical protein B0F90DRAFT_1644327 [Multifurca ochricompacta]